MLRVCSFDRKKKKIMQIKKRKIGIEYVLEPITIKIFILICDFIIFTKKSKRYK